MNKQFVVEVTSESRFPADRSRIKAAVERTLTEFGVTGLVSVSVRITGDRKMKWLNETFRHVAGTTDVLSFPSEETNGHKGGFVYPDQEAFPLGDIVISYPKARAQAAEREVLVDEEIDALIVHGVKSLLGKHPEE